MNIWTNKSIELANQRNYLDLLFKIYPMSVNLRRELKKKDIDDIKKYFNNKDSKNLLNVLLAQEIFPIKDSYIAYLKRDKSQHTAESYSKSATQAHPSVQPSTHGQEGRTRINEGASSCPPQHA